MNNTGLICVTHDPNGKNISLVRKLSQKLNHIYSDLYITVSEVTDKDLIDELERNRFNVRVIPKKGAAHARREVLKFGLHGSNQHFHYCDFDRLLTWTDKYDYELKDIVDEIPRYDLRLELKKCHIKSKKNKKPTKINKAGFKISILQVLIEQYFPDF